MNKLFINKYIFTHIQNSQVLQVLNILSDIILKCLETCIIIHLKLGIMDWEVFCPQIQKIKNWTLICMVIIYCEYLLYSI